MGKADRIKKLRETKPVKITNAEMVKLAIAKGQEQGFMRAMQYVDEKLETMEQVAGIGTELKKRINEHFLKFGKEEEI